MASPVLRHQRAEPHIAGTFHLGPKIGSGSFGDVYMGTNVHTAAEVAVKLERRDAPRKCLAREAQVYIALSGARCVPQVHWTGYAGDYGVMVIDLLGPSLEDLLQFCGGKFGLKTVLSLGDQMITCLEALHARGLVHRDVKPDNLCIGLGVKASKVHIIDFGLADPYVDPVSGRHVPGRTGQGLTGTARFVSVNTHLGHRQSRRDDLEALGYVMLYFLHGRLPWQSAQAAGSREKHELIGEIKMSCSPQELCEGLPKEFETYLHYCRRLAFDEEPDYAYLRALLRGLFVREGFRDDDFFDWTAIGTRALQEGGGRGAEKAPGGKPGGPSTAATTASPPPKPDSGLSGTSREGPRSAREPPRQGS